MQLLFGFRGFLCLLALVAGSLAAEEQTCSTTSPALSQPVTLKYWNGRGLMEIGRIILAIAGKFPGDYEDARFDSPPANLESNLGRMPVIQVGEEFVGQSVAIYYYLAAETNLMGTSNLEAAQILSIGEHLREMMLAYRAVVPAGAAPEQEASAKWFDTGAEDVSGTADSSKRSSRFMKWWMGRIENALGPNGFAVGKKLSLADIQLYYTFAETLKDHEASPDFPQWRREPFGDKVKVDQALINYPKISASITAVMENPNFQKWMATRGPQGF